MKVKQNLDAILFPKTILLKCKNKKSERLLVGSYKPTRIKEIFGDENARYMPVHFGSPPKRFVVGVKRGINGYACSMVSSQEQ